MAKETLEEAPKPQPPEGRVRFFWQMPRDEVPKSTREWLEAVQRKARKNP